MILYGMPKGIQRTFLYALALDEVVRKFQTYSRTNRLEEGLAKNCFLFSFKKR